MIRAAGRRRIGLLGLSFKESTDDLRESPLVTLAELLIGKGYELTVYDRNVRLASLMGANREYILNHIPHIGRLLVDRPEQLFDQSEVIVVASPEGDFGSLLRDFAGQKIIIDLAGVWDIREDAGSAGGYEGIAW
jgi:GDP-mannose 6-dehydrogenase